jgi:hypothetical protein
MSRTLVLDLPGLSQRLLSMLPDEDRPAWLSRLTEIGHRVIEPIIPAVTLTAQATLTTGTLPQDHGMIANGLAVYRDPTMLGQIDLGDDSAAFRKTVSFWEQSNDLLQAPRVWQAASPKPQAAKVALLFFQSSIGAADVVVTPKPRHTEDGRTVSDCWTNPPELNAKLTEQLGVFPLHHYWGPMANIESSKWIAGCAQIVWSDHQPDVQFNYIPHLDYDAQRIGPTHPKTLAALGEVLAALTPLVERVEADGGRVVLLSEYGMTEVSRSVAPNVALREAGLLPLTASQNRMAAPDIDFANATAFALCDHQIAHVYTNDIDAALQAVGELPGVGCVYVGDDREAIGLNTDRAGEIVLIAESDAWFEYRWWTDFADAPPWAWSVDIHRKPGFDPLEMFFDPAAKRIRADQPELVKGSHGAKPNDAADWPVLLGIESDGQPVQATDVAGLLF